MPASTSSSRLAGAGLCVLSAAGFATLGILAKIAYAAGLSLTGILSLRFGGAALLIGAYLTITRGRAAFPARRLALRLLALGLFGYAVQASLYFLSLQRISASLAALFLYLYPVYVALLEWVVSRKTPDQRVWIALAASFLGAALTLGPIPSGASESVGRVDPLGVAFVLLSGMWYAGYILISSRVTPLAGALPSTAWIAAGACVTTSLVGWATDSWVVPWTGAALLLLVALILFSTILPVSTFLAGLSRVGPTTASLLSTLEPVFTVLLAAAVLGEALTPRQLAGGALVVLGIVVLNLPRRPVRER